MYVKKVLNVFCDLLLDILLLICLLLILLNIRPVETIIALSIFSFLALLYFIIIKKSLILGKQRQKQDRKKTKASSTIFNRYKRSKNLFKRGFFLKIY